MTFAQAFASQLAHPRGWAGRLLGHAMDLANRRPTELALSLLDPQPGERVLDAGCGTGAALAALLQRAGCDACGIDASPAMVAAARRRLGGKADCRVARIEDAPFPPASFDAVLALNVLYFEDCDGRMSTSLRRLLKPGGRLVAYVTHRDTMQEWSFANSGYHRLYDEHDLVEALERGGFAANAISVHALPVAPGVAGLVAVAVNQESPACPRNGAHVKAAMPQAA